MIKRSLMVLCICAAIFAVVSNMPGGRYQSGRQGELYAQLSNANLTDKQQDDILTGKAYWDTEAKKIVDFNSNNIEKAINKTTEAFQQVLKSYNNPAPLPLVPTGPVQPYNMRHDINQQPNFVEIDTTTQTKATEDAAEGK